MVIDTSSPAYISGIRNGDIITKLGYSAYNKEITIGLVYFPVEMTLENVSLTSSLS